jgi:predicted site-specific integrase-resolvase
MATMIEFTVKEFAEKERVSQRTVWAWIAKGALEVRRNPGGRLRVIERRESDKPGIASQGRAS